MNNIDRETAIALAEEAGAYYAAGTNPGTVYALSAAGLERLCNLVAAHLRKAAEPVAAKLEAIQRRNIKKVVRLLAEYCFESADHPRYGVSYLTLANSLTAKDGFKWPDLEPLFTHPPEADKLLQQALEALEYRLQQTRPIHQADSVMEAIRTYLEGKK